MKRAIFLSLAIVMVASLALSGCAAKKQTVKVATDATWPPFEAVNEGTKELEGFDIELMEAIAKEAGLEIEWVNVSWDPLLAGVATGQYDASISAMTITDDRKEQFNFTEPYYNAGQLVAVQVGNADINGPDDLTGKTVGAQLGTTGAIEVEQMEGVTLKNYDDIGQAFMDLMNGQIDAVVADSPLVYGYVGQNADKIKAVGEPFTDEFYGIAVKKGADDLLAKLNKGLAAVQQKGLIEQLNDKWIKAAE